MGTSIGTLNEIKAKDKEIFTIKREKHSNEEEISITIPSEFTTETDKNKKKAILRAAVISALSGKKFIAEDSKSKAELDKLVNDLFDKNIHP